MTELWISSRKVAESVGPISFKFYYDVWTVETQLRSTWRSCKFCNFSVEYSFLFLLVQKVSKIHQEGVQNIAARFMAHGVGIYTVVPNNPHLQNNSVKNELVLVIIFGTGCDYEFLHTPEACYRTTL